MKRRPIGGSDIMMRTTADILGAHKLSVMVRFFEFLGRKPKMPAIVPTDPQEALRLGMKLGRKEGYGEGLLVGTDLGLDVGLEAMDEMLAQPVFFGSIGSA